MAEKGIQDTLTFKLMVALVELVQASGVTRQEATAAIKAAGALIADVELLDKPKFEIQT
jgi:hypothetical protein